MLCLALSGFGLPGGFPVMSSLRLSFTATTANRWNRCRCGWLLNIIGNQALILRFPLLMPLVSDCPHRPASVWYAYCPLRSDEVCSRIWGQGFCVRSPVSEAPVPELRFLRSGFLSSGFLCLGLKVASLELRVPSPSPKSESHVRVPSPKLPLYILVVS